MIVNLTKHSINQAIKRNPKVKTEKKANFFLRGLFNSLYKKDYRQGRKVKFKELSINKYKLWDGKHCIIYKRYIGEVKIITYYYLLNGIKSRTIINLLKK